MAETVADELARLVDLPDQSLKFDWRLASAPKPIDDVTRARMWRTLGLVLDHGPVPGSPGNAVGLLLGRIQSGKTTAMTGITALAHDKGYRVVVAMLGTTKLLLNQNRDRFLTGLGIAGGLRSDYTWIHLDPTVEGRRLGREVHQALESRQTALITVLKHSRRLTSLAEHLANADLGDASALVLDDEADQASLNTMVANASESPTYRSVADLMATLPSHIYVQVTATPFAPLLLDPQDRLSPSFVEFLEPGPGYTGAREFFLDSGDVVVRLVGPGEALTTPPRTLPPGLQTALANYLIGAAMLLAKEPGSAPVSMLVHPTHRVAVHDRVAVLLRRELTRLGGQIDVVSNLSDLPEPLAAQHADLTRWGVESVSDAELMDQLRRVVRLARISVVNSSVDQHSVVWSSTPAHILVGGNKLDRGFTVEGLTVTYLSRTASTQADTLAQRARAFGYRHQYLPYCRFFASSATVEAFRSSVLTEEAMRIGFREWVSAGKELADWGEHVGFVLGQGLTPTRPAVAPWLTRTPTRGWHVLANPSMQPDTDLRNKSLLDEFGLFEAPNKSYGRLSFHTIEHVPISRVARLLHDWFMPPRSGWSRYDIVAFVERVAQLQPELLLDVALLEGLPAGSSRIRSWRHGLGFSNLMQGRDNNFADLPDQYPGDRSMFGDESGLQVHWVRPRGSGAKPVFTLAIHLGDDILAATEVRRA